MTGKSDVTNKHYMSRTVFPGGRGAKGFLASVAVARSDHMAGATCEKTHTANDGKVRGCDDGELFRSWALPQ